MVLETIIIISFIATWWITLAEAFDI